jgi:muconolactone D-isomerase
MTVEFLVHVEINWPPDADPDLKEEIFQAELRRGQELARAGLCKRLWRIPGRWANYGLYEAPDATAVHEAIASLPLWPWMSVQVTALAEHPNDPVRLGIVAGAAGDR